MSKNKQGSEAAQNKTVRQVKLADRSSAVIIEDSGLNHSHNSKKESLGQNTKR